ncbi:hypothetical protein STEG23_006141 [Scotinomys teguina]
MRRKDSISQGLTADHDKDFHACIRQRSKPRNVPTLDWKPRPEYWRVTEALGIKPSTVNCSFSRDMTSLLHPFDRPAGSKKQLFNSSVLDAQKGSQHWPQSRFASVSDVINKALLELSYAFLAVGINTHSLAEVSSSYFLWRITKVCSVQDGRHMARDLRLYLVPLHGYNNLYPPFAQVGNTLCNTVDRDAAVKMQTDHNK